MKKEILKKIAEEYGTPTFVFDTDEFRSRADKIKQAIGDIPLCFSIKANPFLLYDLPESITYVEVCSPGELQICKKLNVLPEKIIYSGVNKGRQDVLWALEYNVGILTAESINHIKLINELANLKGLTAKVILRYTSANQFGMDASVIEDIIKNKCDYPNIDLIGLHYYSGTQKKNEKVIEKDILFFEKFIESLNEKYNYIPDHVEYGPGMSADYFSQNCDEKDDETIKNISALLKQFSQKYNLSVEFGRALACSCGTYLTSVADIKTNCETTYVICDGGINHLKYYGQTMAMQVPPIELLKDSESDIMSYTLCGSLCTVADLLVRNVELPKLEIGDVLAFGRCGAYSVTEGISLFLSRTMPKILSYSEKDSVKVLRDSIESFELNS